MEIKEHSDYLIYDDGRIYSKKRNIFLALPIDIYGYITINLDQKNYKHHVLLANHFIPNPDNKPYIDHINGIRSDNRLENLRWVTRSENGFNRKQNETNIYGKGVSLDKNRNSNKKYLARITSNNKTVYLGYFKTPEEASIAYQTKAREIHGEFYREI